MNNKRDMRERKQVDHLVNIGDQGINLSWWDDWYSLCLWTTHVD